MKDEIDYATKIATFNLLVNNNNDDIAVNYLTLTNWDENEAAILYNKENKGANAKLINQNNLNNINPNFYQNDINNIIPPDDNIIFDQPPFFEKINPYNNFQVKNNNFSKLNKYAECPIFTDSILDGLKFWKIDNRGYCQNFEKFKNIIKLYKVFINNLKTKVGIIYLYNKSTLNNALTILRNLNNNEQVKDLLNQRCVIHPMIDGCLESSSIVKSLKINNFPTMIICLYKNEINFCVVGKINNIMNNIPLLTQKLIEAQDLLNEIKKNYQNANLYRNAINRINNNINNIINNKGQINKNNNNNNPNNNINKININNNIINNNPINNNNSNAQGNILDDPRNYLMDDDIIKNDTNTYMTDGDILKKQEEEMKSLERQEEEKKRKKKEEEERKKREEIEEKNKIENLLKQLPEEPSDDDPNKCTIMFRFPDGEKTVERKFLKTDKISLLYLYIKSLGREIYSDQNEKDFSIVQPFPFKNYNDLQNNTLEQEGLFPNALLQIRIL